MSTAPEAPAGGAEAVVSKPGQMFRSCWSCRLLSGGGLILSGAYVFNAARKVMRQGAPTSMGTVAQITFAASKLWKNNVDFICGVFWDIRSTTVSFLGLAAWGIVVIADPVGKAQRKTWCDAMFGLQDVLLMDNMTPDPRSCSLASIHMLWLHLLE